MKRSACYSVDYTTNTITITRKFHEQASTLDNTEATALMQQLRALGMKIVVQPKREQKSSGSRMTYKKMHQYILCVADSDKYLAEFAAMKKAALSQGNAHAYVWNWFKKTFPNYSNVPEFDENLKIVVTPANYDAEDDAA